ncbi:hypothetical protein ACFV9C_41560 [Kribbella sp. NPDC059898]|uniref:hypothetical protein n=1 Tax=Kribbella sp. NPDC059898 TaxID=3346995 RepID=UPI00365B9149
MSNEDEEDLALIQKIRDRGEDWIPADEAEALMDQWLDEAEQRAQSDDASQPAGGTGRRAQAASAPDLPTQPDRDGLHED